MACSNTFGLVTGAFLLGFGLSEIPKGIWKNINWTIRQKVLSHKVAKMAVKLDDAHKEFSNAIVLKEDPTFKPQGGRFGENDMDYDTDEKSMATLRRRLRIAREQYCRYRSEYMSFVLEALELEDTIKNYERGGATGWKFISSFRAERTGKLGASLDTIEATILPSGVDLSLFSILINSVGKQEMLVQIFKKVQDEADDSDGFDPSGLIILQKERSWLERGHKVGENVIPLARNFNSVSIDIDIGSTYSDKAITDTRIQDTTEVGKRDQLKPLNEEAQQDIAKESISKNYSGIREHRNKQASSNNSAPKESTSLTVDVVSSESAMRPPSGGLASKWESMKSGIFNFRSNMEAKHFLPLRQTQEDTMSSRVSSTESLDEIFQRLKRPTLDLRDHGVENDILEQDMELMKFGRST
ncbi:hypothetical protein COLO4_32311 [Corchorus olitorius]|uniref:LMBR1-like membrane protein n=1 Tax=Corchorus olitorius TaxID=93759 RepID=A0A1R3GZU9_9ROSI|nr:hypothetical protein COLO4_32311 [Corchorus olitorius]